MGKLGLNNAIYRLHQIYVFTYNNRTVVHIVSSIQSEQKKRTEQKGKIHPIHWYTHITRSQFTGFYYNLTVFSKI